ncbi:unnamed protein product [Rhizophagus irregularis]|nr:unnamed protein product [Rhizophagus irregularis]
MENNFDTPVDYIINTQIIKRSDKITKIIQTKNIYFVTEDTLRNYLKENFPSLNWLDKYGLALQLSNICTKEKWFTSNSIPIQQNSLILSDSGLKYKHIVELF